MDEPNIYNAEDQTDDRSRERIKHAFKMLAAVFGVGAIVLIVAIFIFPSPEDVPADSTRRILTTDERAAIERRIGQTPPPLTAEERAAIENRISKPVASDGLAASAPQLTADERTAIEKRIQQ